MILHDERWQISKQIFLFRFFQSLVQDLPLESSVRTSYLNNRKPSFMLHVIHKIKSVWLSRFYKWWKELIAELNKSISYYRGRRKSAARLLGEVRVWSGIRKYRDGRRNHYNRILHTTEEGASHADSQRQPGQTGIHLHRNEQQR